MGTKENKITIGSQKDAWQFINNAALDSKYGTDLVFEFKKWPVIEINFKGERFEDGLLPASIANSIYELQKDVYKSYKLLKYGDESSGRLSQEEKDQLEIQVQIKKGSLDISAVLDKIFEILLEKASSMEPRELLITTAIIGIGIGGGKVLDYFKEENDKKRDHEKQMADKKIINQLIENNDRYSRAIDITEDSNTRFIRNIKKEGETLRIGENQEYTITDATELKSKVNRRKFEEIEIEIIGKIIDVNYSNEDPIVLFVGPKGNRWTAKMDLQDSRKVNYIKLSNGSEVQLKLTVSARESEDGEIKDMVIVDCI